MNILYSAERPLQDSRVQRDRMLSIYPGRRRRRVRVPHPVPYTNRPRSHWRVHVPEMARGPRDRRNTATVNKVHAVMAKTHPARTLTQAFSDNSRARRISTEIQSGL